MTLALKEWPATIQALDQGSLIFLLRKGGIHDRGDNFALPASRAILFPSYEHQKAECLKSTAVTTSTAYQVDDQLIIQNWVEFIDSVIVRTLDLISVLNPYHIWTDEFLRQRYDWKPERPLMCVFCRTFRLNQPFEIRFRQEYGGCRSFIDVQEDIDLQTGQAVMSDTEFWEGVSEVKRVLGSKGSYS